MAVPGYRIVEQLGGDESAILTRSVRVSDGRPVLLRLPAGGRAGSGALASLTREREIMALLALPGVPRPLELDPTTGALALEDGGGELLATRLARGALTTEEFLGLARSLALTVAEIHRRGIIHRNLNPVAILADPGHGKARIVDFSLASRLPEDTQQPRPPRQLRGRLAYMSPEQTGRMNRTVDHRTDLYSLGVTLYYALTGRLPFHSTDPLELVHWQIARQPQPAEELNPNAPPVLSDIVMKLLAKTPDERYQSAAGLAVDVEACAAEFSRTGWIQRFTLGRHDLPDRLLIPQRLYGREAEVDRLLSVFSQVVAGPPALILVGGYPGVGKTALVNEVHKPIARERGYFVAGKFDQLARDIPYAGVVQALRALVVQVLAEADEEIDAYRRRLREALGSGAGVVSALVPEVETLIGRQPPPSELTPAEARNRFHYTVSRFLSVFARPEHPLALFLDDLQWADGATLVLLSYLLTTPTLRHLCVIGAYRDNEVSAEHPLRRTVAELQDGGYSVEQIVLHPLALPHLGALVADTLRGDRGESDRLAELILAKTDGNPFFVIQFLRSLVAEDLLQLDRARECWTYDLARIDGAAMTDNVIELMGRRLAQLPAATREVVALGACIGSSFTLQTLAVVRQRGLRDVAAELWPAIEAGLVLPAREEDERLLSATDQVLAEANPSYRFLHDRVQHAAYDLIPPDRQPPLHLEVGRLLLGEAGETVADDQLFAIVNHLNLGGRLIDDPVERRRVAQLDLRAGRRARESAAFRAALGYFERGLELLPSDRWGSAYELSLALTMDLAECQYLCGHFDEAEQSFETLLHESRSPLEKAAAHRMRLVQYESMSRYAEALRVGREALALFGVVLPQGEPATGEALDAEIGAIQDALGDRSIASLVDLPRMEDRQTRMIVTLLTAMWASAYILGDAGFAFLLSARMVALSIAHGNTEDSAYGYVTHAISIGPVRGNYEAAYEWGSLALRVNDRLQDRRLRAKIHQQFNAHVSLWRRPFAVSMEHAREACRSGLETGDFTYAGYGAFTETWSALAACRDLERFIRDFTPTVALLSRIRMSALADAQRLFLSWALALKGGTLSPLSLAHAGFDEERYRADYHANPFCMTFLYAARVHLGLTFGDYAFALDAARTAKQEAWTPPGTLWPVLLDFWSALASAAVYDTLPPEELDRERASLETTRDALARLGDNSPENFRAPALLVAAEVARVGGQLDESADRLGEAVRWARHSESLQHEALAHELLGRLWLGRGDEDRAAAGLRAARSCYATLGAAAKVRDLEARHVDLLGRDEPAVEDAAEPGGSRLDAATALKAARAIAREIEIERLLKALVRIAVENAGAERGLLLLERDGRLAVVAEGSTGEDAVRLLDAPLDARHDLCRAIVLFVYRTGESVLVDDARDDPRWLGDPYVARLHPRSILCAPIVHQGRRVGLIYVENNLATGAFAPERFEMLEFLAAEAAVALENARLYEDMRQEVARRTRAEEALRSAHAELEALKDRLQAENVYLQEELRTEHNFEEIVGTSPPLLEALARVERVSRTETTVLILGETGSGKELFARAIHSRSARRGRPLVKVNCGAIPSGLVESELFGHVKGAFTGAVQTRVGRFELADGGTLFLDEVGELPPETQVRLLRVLQEKEFEPVGSSRTVRVDVRVIAATNRDIDEAVRDGRFRADLLYRLNVFPIRVPPLRERAADIPQVVAFLLTGLSKKLGKPLRGFSRRSMDILMRYSWPGNVRELQNIVERAAIVSPGPVIELDTDPLGAGSGTPPQGLVAGARATLQTAERNHILSVLRSTRGVVEGPTGAAQILGLHPNTLRSRMKKLGISRHDIS